MLGNLQGGCGMLQRIQAVRERCSQNLNINDHFHSLTIQSDETSGPL